MRSNQAFPSEYLKSDSQEIPPDQDVIVTISRVEIKTLGQGKDAEEKPVLYFEEFDKGMVLNRTNWNTITKIHGSDDSDDWIGLQITLYSADVQFGADWTRGLRVRPRAPQAKKASAPAQPARKGGRPPQTEEAAPVRSGDPVDEDIPF